MLRADDIAGPDGVANFEQLAGGEQVPLPEQVVEGHQDGGHEHLGCGPAEAGNVTIPLSWAAVNSGACL